MSRTIVVSALVASLLGAPGPLLAAGNEKAECATAAETAEKLREEKHFQKAREGLLRCSRETCPKVVRADCLQSLATLEQSQPTVVFRARDHEGRDIVDVEVTVDGVLLSQRLDGRAWPLDPGAHSIVLDAPGKGLVTSRETVVVAEGEKNRVIAVTLESPSRPLPPAASSASPTVPTPPRETARPSRGAVPYVVGAVGVAGLLTFGVVELIARSRYTELRDGCGTSGTCDSSDVSALRTKYVISGVALGVGVVGVVTSAVWLSLSPGASVAPSASRDGAGASLRVRF